MEESDLILYGVTAVAFVVGYLVVGFVIKKLKALNERPPLNEELWREQEKAQAARNQESAGGDPNKPEETTSENSHSNTQK